MLPHDGVGGDIPTPKKESADSSKISEPTSIAVRTKTKGKAFGKICRTIIRAFDAPDTRPAATNSRSRSDSVWPRTNSVTPGQVSKPRMTTSVTGPGANNTDTIKSSGIFGTDSSVLIKNWVTSTTKP